MLCHSPTMSLSVSGSCLKSFLKSSLRCLYVGLSTCRHTHGQRRTRTRTRTHPRALHAPRRAPPPSGLFASMQMGVKSVGGA